METPPFQYSPAQILKDAQRAEIGGHKQFAHQFYRQIIDQYPTSPEASVAQEAIARLMSAQSQGYIAQKTTSSAIKGAPQFHPSAAMRSENSTTHQSPAQNQNTTSSAHASPTALPPEVPSSAGHTFSHYPQQGEFNQPTVPKGGSFNQSPQQTGNQQTTHPGEANFHNRLSSSANGAKGNLNLEPAVDASIAKRPPPFKESKLRRYPLGNWLAMLLVVFGSCAMVIGFGLLISVIIAPRLIGNLVSGGSPLSVAVIALMALIIGIVITVNGIVAQAVFANARVLHNLALSELQRYSTNRRS